MANLDYQAQLTLIYNKMAATQSSLARLSQMSQVNTIQSALQSQMDSLSSRLDTLTGEVQKLQLNVNDLLTILRSK